MNDKNINYKVKDILTLENHQDTCAVNNSPEKYIYIFFPDMSDRSHVFLGAGFSAYFTFLRAVYRFFLAECDWEST